jgi:hypothetical protein
MLLLPACGDGVAPLVEAVLPERSAAGQPVDVVGQHFGDGDGVVSFGGRAAEVLLWTDRRVRVRVPSCPEGALLLVVTAGGAPSNAVRFYVEGADQSAWRRNGTRPFLPAPGFSIGAAGRGRRGPTPAARILSSKSIIPERTGPG